jgi:hypothetical protein
MKLHLSMLAASLLIVSGIAFANHCPMDMKKIDEALAANPKLSEAEMADVKKLRAEGEASHNAGDHAKSLEALGKAMKILKVQ